MRELLPPVAAWQEQRAERALREPRGVQELPDELPLVLEQPVVPLRERLGIAETRQASQALWPALRARPGQLELVLPALRRLPGAAEQLLVAEHPEQALPLERPEQQADPARLQAEVLLQS